MTGLPQNEFNETFEVNKIRNSMLTPEAKRTKIQEVKSSFIDKPKNSSQKTIFNLANCMVGSSIIVFPLVFSSSGILTSLIVLVFMAVITCKTCLLEIAHFKILEADYPDVIERVLGKKWWMGYSICSVLLLFIAGVIYFMLICNMFYMVVSFILNHAGVEYSAKSDMDFTKFSYQYSGIIMIVFCFALFSLKDLSVIMKICQYGIISIILFIVYIIYKGVSNISHGNVTLDSVKLFTPDFATLCGVFSLSFMCHNVLIPVIRNNHDETKNKRDIVLGYVMTGSIYGLIGVFGCIAIAGLDTGKTKYQTVLEYFSDEILTVVIEVLLFLQLISVIPIIWYITRSQFFALIYKNDKVPEKYFILANTFFSLVCLIIQMLDVDPTLVISLNGGVIGYLLVYVVPIKLHLKCLYSEHPEEDKTEVENKIEENICIEEKPDLNPREPLLDKEKESTFVHTVMDQDGVKIENYMPEILQIGFNKKSAEMQNKFPCRSNHLTRKAGVPKKLRYTFYGIVMMIGFAFAVIKIVNIIMGE